MIKKWREEIDYILDSMIFDLSFSKDPGYKKDCKGTLKYNSQLLTLRVLELKIEMVKFYKVAFNIFRRKK